MKKLFFSVTLITVLLMSCKNTPQPVPPPEPSMPSVNSSVSFSEITGNELKLIEVRINGSNTGFNRSDLVSNGFGDFFTLNFDASNISGVGAPNQYSAPYTLGNGKNIKILMVRSTMMAAFREPDKLREHDYFNYIQSAYRWDQVNDNLELYSKIENGSEIVLVFSQ